MISPFSIIKMFNTYTQWTDFLPETLFETMRDVSKANMNTRLSEEFSNMVLAIQTCINSDRPWNEWDVFENTALAINGEIPITDTLQEVFLPEISFAVNVMNRIKNPDFSDDVIAYIAAVANRDGFILLPSNLKFAQSALDKSNHATEYMKNRPAKEYIAAKRKKRKYNVDE